MIIGDKTDNYNSIIYNINYILKTTHLWNRLFILQVTRFASLDLRLKHSGLDAINDRKAWSSFSHPWTSWVARLVSFLSPTETLRPVYMYMNSWIPNLNWCHVCSLRFTYISPIIVSFFIIFWGQRNDRHPDETIRPGSPSSSSSVDASDDGTSWPSTNDRLHRSHVDGEALLIEDLGRDQPNRTLRWYIKMLLGWANNEL